MLYYKNDNGLLYCGDVLEEMKNIPNDSIDLIITSPPYNLKYHHINKKKIGCYSDNLPEKEYQNWQIEIFKECYRVLKTNGSMFYNHKNRIFKGVQITPYEWIFKTEFLVKQEIVWVNKGPNFDPIRFYPYSERIYWLAKDSKTKLKNVINKHDIFDWNDWKPENTNRKKEKFHDRMFPLQLPIDLISCFPDSKYILDPFMGSGTTALASEKLNKKWIGIDIDQDFCDLTIKKLTEII
jgi:site-specific DNA-methyltransferase (adenine-specific)